MRATHRVLKYWQEGGAPRVAHALRRGAESRVVGVLFTLLSPLVYETARLFLNLGYWPHIKHPRSFNEKIMHSILFNPHPLSSIVADKWRVREYVESKGLKEILNDVFYAGDDPDEIPFEDLPDRFVVKASHGSRWNIFVQNKKLINSAEIIEQCKKWLGQRLTVTAHSHEKHYDLIPPRVIVERYIEDNEHGLPLDYKFHCFHGKVQYIKVFFDRYVNTRALTFDTGWKAMDIWNEQVCRRSAKRPSHLEEMIRVAESLSADFDFIRVDLYSPNDAKIVFSELTLTPANADLRLLREWDFKMGKLW